MKNGIYLITGVMASGKSTTAELLAAKFEKGVHLRGDAFRRMIVSGREDMTASPSKEAIRQLYMRYNLTAQAAKTYWENGFTVILQDNYYGEALSYMENLLRTCPLEIIVLCPSVEAVTRREKSRNKTGYSDFTVEELYADFIRETPRIGFWLDTSEQTPEQSVGEIISHFEAD